MLTLGILAVGAKLLGAKLLGVKLLTVLNLGGGGSLSSGQVVPQQPTGSDTSSTYPLWQQQYTYDLANAATNLASQPYTPFPGPQVAAPSAATLQAEQMALSNVGSFQPALTTAGALTSAAGTPLTAAQINNYMNPYMGSVIGGLTSASNTNFNQNVMPSLQDRFISSGQAASPQEMQAANNAMYQQQQALDQSISGALATGYQNATNTAQAQKGMQLAAGAQTGQLGALQSQLEAANVGQVAAAGQQQDITAQANINAAMNNFYQQQQWPYQNLQYASNILRGQPVASNTMMVGMAPASQSTYAPSPLSSFIGTSLGANALMNSGSGTSGTAAAATPTAYPSVGGGRRGGHVRAGALSDHHPNRRGVPRGALTIASAA